MRTHASRNHERLLAVARDVLAENGTDASLREIARRAGVGIGTLYRHFGTREALLQAALGDHLDSLRQQAERLQEAPDPHAALTEWTTSLAAAQQRLQGLPESILSALHDPSSALHGSCVEMRSAAGRLLSRAQAAGTVAAAVTVDEFLALTAGAAWTAQHSPVTLNRLATLTLAAVRP